MQCHSCSFLPRSLPIFSTQGLIPSGGSSSIPSSSTLGEVLESRNHPRTGLSRSEILAFRDFFTKPTIGWIQDVHLNNKASVTTTRTQRLNNTAVNRAKFGVKGRTPWVLNMAAARLRGINRIVITVSRSMFSAVLCWMTAASWLWKQHGLRIRGVMTWLETRHRGNTGCHFAGIPPRHEQYQRDRRSTALIAGPFEHSSC